MATPLPRRSSNASMYSSISGAAPPPTSSTAPPSVSGSTATTTTRRRPALALSPGSSSFISTPGSQYSTSAYGASQPISPRYLTFSSAASNTGSVATTAAPGGPTRFKRGHVRKKAPAIIGVKSANPDDLDLMALEDPDEVFRRFGVRDVRGLEKRASDAAAAKVAELRTMVGERYRDLLSAADSIVRMRSAAEKLVGRFERVESGISLGDRESGPDDTPTKRPKQPKIAHRTSAGSTKQDRTLASPPTLSLTIQLLLTLPSTVHGLLESSSFLPAARLEGVGRIVYRELSNYSSEDDDGDGGGDGGIKDAFPIIERQWETVSSLGTVVTRRAMADLRRWDAPPLSTAETLAAILMLENASLPSSLATLLEARSKTLSVILSSPTASGAKKAPDVETVLKHLHEALGVVLRTVEAANTIFGASADPSATTSEGLLLRLLREIENPTGTSEPATSSTELTTPKLAPILRTLPNYPLLARHLPPSILDFTPFLSILSTRNAFSSSAAHAQIQTWFTRETQRVVQGVTSWIAHLRGGAQTLALVRSAVRSNLPTTPDAAGGRSDIAALRSSLDAAIEARFEEVYRQHLRTLVQRVEPALSNLLEKLPSHPADLDTAEFLLEAPLPFPKTSHYTLLPLLPSRGTVGMSTHSSTSDAPFESFLDHVHKRVVGRSPLIDRALSELEAHAKDLRKDLQGWLETDDHGGDTRLRLREIYVGSARDMLQSVYEALSSVMDQHVKDVTASLFLGNFVHLLAGSKTFTTDLLLGSAPIARSQEAGILSEWHSRLLELQARSLDLWRAHAVERAVEKLHDVTNPDSLRATTLRAREAGRALTNGSMTSANQENTLLPGQPSPAVLSAMRNLVGSERQVGLHRTQADPTIVRTLLEEVANASLPIIESFVPTLGQLEDARTWRDYASQVAWDVTFLGRIWGAKEAEWERTRQKLLELADPSLASSVDTSTLHYLQRTQTIFASLLAGAIASSKTSGSGDGLGWLPLGPSTAVNESVTLTGLVKPGPRLGLLPTRS